jgi:hypothetical protein
MIYQLPNGNSIEISVEQYLNMSDAELDYLNASNSGDYIENPWFGSVLSKNCPKPNDEEFLLNDLTSISDEEKLVDPDIDILPDYD